MTIPVFLITLSLVIFVMCYSGYCGYYVIAYGANIAYKNKDVIFARIERMIVSNIIMLSVLAYIIFKLISK